MRKPILRELKYTAKGQGAKQKRSWGLNPQVSDSNAFVFLPPHAGRNHKSDETEMDLSDSGGWGVPKKDRYPARKTISREGPCRRSLLHPLGKDCPIHTLVLKGWPNLQALPHDPSLTNQRIPLPSPDSNWFKKRHMIPAVLAIYTITLCRKKLSFLLDCLTQGRKLLRDVLSVTRGMEAWERSHIEVSRAWRERQIFWNKLYGDISYIQ